MSRLFVRRVSAYVLDIVLLFVVLGPLGFLVQWLLEIVPTTAHEIYATLLLNFSVPAWTYFTLSDQSQRGMTLGKRLLKIQTRTQQGQQVRPLQAFTRTATKMLPWEMAHIASFLLVPEVGAFGLTAWVGLGVSYALTFTYLIAAWRTQGTRSIHDYVASTAMKTVS
ncbi:MAG: hypothetical protein RhofKO_08800 [Rhodothermales bacterium]